MLSALVRSSAFTRTAHTFVSRRVPGAFFSSGSHDDFAPKRKVVEGEDDALKLIKVSWMMYVLLHRSSTSNLIIIPFGI
jgi:hypothetical protein